MARSHRARPCGIAILRSNVDILTPFIDSPIETAVFVAIPVAIGIWVYMLAKKPIHELFSKSSLGGESIVLNLIRAAVACGIIFFLGENVFHIEMRGVVETLGVTTLLVTISLQDLIRNVLSGLQIIVTDEFLPGDQLIVEDERGEVVDIGWRNTTFRDKDDNARVIPNSEIYQHDFLHLNEKMARRHTVSCYIKPHLDLDVVANDIMALADEALTELGCKAEEPSEVRYLGTTIGGIETSIRIFLTDIKYTTPATDAVIRAISRRGYLADGTINPPEQDQLDWLASGEPQQLESTLGLPPFANEANRERQDVDLS